MFKNRAFSLILGMAILIAMMSQMGGCKSTTGPDPLPTPTPLPTDTPTPPPQPFRLLSTDQLRSDLHSAVNCCAPPPPLPDIGLIEGWPGFSNRILELYARTGVRLTEVRIGPGGDMPPGEALAMLEDRARAAEGVGLGILVGIDDCWVRRHGMNIWGEGADATHRPPRHHHKEWARQVGAVAARHPNVVLFDGNETFVCRASRDWTQGLENAAREGGYSGLFGSNGENGAGDFQIHHGFRTVEYGSILLESDNREHSVAEWRALRERSDGAIAFWRGPMTWEEWVRLLEGR